MASTARGGFEFRLQHRKLLMRTTGALSVLVFLLMAAAVAGIIIMTVTWEADFYLYAKNYKITFTKFAVIVRGVSKEKVFDKETLHPELIRYVVMAGRWRNVPTKEIKTVFRDKSNKKLCATGINTAEFNEYIAQNFAVKVIDCAERKNYYS